MSFQNSSFYSTLYEIFRSLKIEDYFSRSNAHIVYPSAQRYPTLWTNQQWCRISIPSIYRLNSSLVYCQLAFPSDDFGRSSLARLLLGSTALLASKAIVWGNYYLQVEEWFKPKEDRLNASFAINSIFDIVARDWILTVLGQRFYENVIQAADIISLCRVPKFPEDLATAFKRGLLAAALMPKERWQDFLTASVLSRATQFRYELDALAIRNPVGSQKGSETVSEPNSTKSGIDFKLYPWKKIAIAADKLYSILQKIPPLLEDCIYLSYSNVLDSPNNSRRKYSIDRQPVRISEADFIETSTMYSMTVQPVENTFTELFNQLAKEQKKIGEYRTKLGQLSQGLNFDSCEFPPMDYNSFKELSGEVALQIRMITEKISSIKYVPEEVQFQEAGNIDLQVAIQAIASQSLRDDMFARDEDTRRNETWTIMIDSSKSLEASSKTVRTTAICVAETAKQMMGQNEWGMFAFSDKITCLKHYDEPYDFNVKSRIGGLRQSGLSYIPDAIRFARNIVSGPNYAKERNYTIVVTDGVAAGYPNIESEVLKSIKEIRMKGVRIAAIGIGSSKVSNFIKTARAVEKYPDLVKAFVDIYYELSS